MGLLARLEKTERLLAMKPCVACAEEIKQDASLCKHCRTRQDDESFTGEIGLKAPSKEWKRWLLPRPALMTIGSIFFLVSVWASLAIAFPNDTTDDMNKVTSNTQLPGNSLATGVDSESSPIAPSPSPSTSPTPPETPNQPAPREESSLSNQPQADDGAKAAEDAEVQRQIDEWNRQVAEERERNDLLEAERRAEAIAEYESRLGYYLSEIDYFEERIAALEVSRDAAYSAFESQYGSPFVRFNTYCGNTDDFFGCVNGAATMPNYEFEITQAESNIDSYLYYIETLPYPY